MSLNSRSKGLIRSGFLLARRERVFFFDELVLRHLGCTICNRTMHFKQFFSMNRKRVGMIVIGIVPTYEFILYYIFDKCYL